MQRMTQELKEIRYQSRTHERLYTLINRVNEESLKRAHRQQVANKATGIDGVTKSEYGENLDENVANLVARMKSFSYKPQPVRRTYIPKTNGKLRPLGIPAYEDRLVQSVMADILNDIYEERFLDCSYGFRPGCKAHDVVRVINKDIMRGKVNWVLDADIKGFFDNVDHEWMMKFLEHDIGDKNFLRYVKRFLKAGYMEDAKRYETDKGTPQGGQISPVLANVYLHYVLDTWYAIKVKRLCKGEVYYIRYADDFLMLFQYEEDARNILTILKERVERFGLQLAEDKTRILPFGRFKGTKESFDFLGFTFLNAKTRNGKYRVGVHTSKKKLKVKRQEFKKWLWTRLTMPVEETLQLINRKLAGHYNYYGVNGNFKSLAGFCSYVQKSYMRLLNRRSQRGKFKWGRFNELWNLYVKPPTIRVNIWYPEPKLA